MRASALPARPCAGALAC